MQQDNILLLDGRNKVISGISKATDMIRGTYGAAGGNIAVEHTLYPYFVMTNDGKTIVDSIKLADQYENIGASVIKEAGDRADKDSGDGRKTTMLMTEAIFKESEKWNAFPMDINRSLNECIPVLNAAIDAQKRDITVDEVGAVAAISSENKETGFLIQSIYKEIGKEGIIEVEPSNLSQTFYDVTEGVRIRGARYFGEYALTENRKAVIKKPKILIARDKITSVDQLNPIIKSLREAGVTELVIYCDDMDLSVASRLAMTHIQGVFKTLIVKAPTLWKDWTFEDLAKITGATIIKATEGKTFKNLTMSDLGTCEKLVVTDEETRVIGIEDVTDYVQAMRDENSEESLLRASFLQTKVAILKVGGNSETEINYNMKKAKDACNASYLALKDGVVAGGGVALRNAAHSLPDTLGGNILKEVLTYPIKQICMNADHIWTDSTQPNEGYDARENEMVDMFEAGIIDPALVIKNAIKNSISIASNVLTAKGASILYKDENIQQVR